jgi:RES domain-containing protein
MPIGWRIVKSRRAASAFDGEGSRLHGGRWSSPGTRIVYTGENRSLAVLEILVHLQDAQLLSRYALIPARFADRFVEAVDAGSLPPHWNGHPAPIALQEIGDRWVAAGRSLVLRVPSAIVPAESNFLINPAHRDFRRLTIGPAEAFRLDPRLL